MGKAERLKEEIGWLKLVFGLLAAVEISLVGWLAQNYVVAPVLMIAGDGLAIILVTASIIRVNMLAYRRMEALECA